MSVSTASLSTPDLGPAFRCVDSYIAALTEAKAQCPSINLITTSDQLLISSGGSEIHLSRGVNALTGLPDDTCEIRETTDGRSSIVVIDSAMHGKKGVVDRIEAFLLAAGNADLILANARLADSMALETRQVNALAVPNLG